MPDLTPQGDALAVAARFVGDNIPIPPMGTWKYLKTNTPPTDWYKLSFDDSGWSSGAAPFGDPTSPCDLPELIGITWDGSTDILLRFHFDWPVAEAVNNFLFGFSGYIPVNGLFWNDGLFSGLDFLNSACPNFVPSDPHSPPNDLYVTGNITNVGANLMAVHVQGNGIKSWFDMTAWNVYDPPITGNAYASPFDLLNIRGDAQAIYLIDIDLSGNCLAVLGIRDIDLSGDCYARKPPLAPGQQNLLSQWKEQQRDALIQKPCTTCGGVDCTDTEIAYSLEGAGLPLVPVCPTGVDCSKLGSGFHLQCCDGTRYDYNFSPEITDEQKRVIIANAMADCARKLAFCTNNCPNPPCDPPCLVPPCIIYGNHLATCPAECPGGGTFIESIAPGTYFAFTQIEADQIAVRAACALAKDHRLCFLGLESVICVDSLYSDEFVMSGKYVAAYPSSDIISVVDGSLPSGIVLNGGSSFITGGRCKLEGTPTVAGTYTFTIGVTLNTFGTPGFGDHQQREYTIKVCAITPDTLPDAKIGVDYDQALFVTPDHDTSTEVWTLITSLPAGLELDPDGFITGKPTGPSESHNVTVKCCFTLDSEPVCCTKQYTLTVKTAASLISYWTFEESSGTRIDSKGANNLVEFLAATPATIGIVGNGAETVDDSSQLRKSASISLKFNPTNGMTICGWFHLIPFTPGVIFVDAMEFRNVLVSGNRFSFTVQNIEGFGLPIDGLYANIIGKLNDVDSHNFQIRVNAIHSAWVFYAIWFDPSDYKFYFQIDNGVKNSVTITDTFSATSDHVDLRTCQGPTGTIFDEVGIWSGVLSDSDRTYLYNAGAGRTYPNVPNP